ncbi:MAG: hypothetical protein IH840_00410 [Candidatus Heimdallarchaeota archaeon]|nr:hypothetical protein [Candidatus Heimdallarchaeota archaeon]
MRLISNVIVKFLIIIFVTTINCNSDSPKNDESNGESVLSLAADKEITICSFNIQFLGHFKKKDNVSLADLLKDYDLVVIQELVAPPDSGQYPNGDSYTADDEAESFFNEMEGQGFSYQLSEEDTGTNDEIHSKTSSTEWWVVFYKPDKIDLADDLPSGFLDADRSNNDDYERVPYAFAFKTLDNTLDFVLISVHLQPGDSRSDANRRKHEIETISIWIDLHDDVEKDFIILGDMNIKDSAELASITPEDFLSLNDECRVTNTLIRDDGSGGKPYDHVMYNPVHSIEIDKGFDMEVINLIDEMESYWTSSEPYPGNPYNHNLFKQYYSDHHPVIFKMIIPEIDDD